MDVARASRRFLDVDTGLPTADNTHEVAQRVAPEARVVYVDDDEEARSIVKRLLEALPRGSYLTVCDGTNVISQAGVEAQRLYSQSGAIPYRLRSRADRRPLRRAGAGGTGRGVTPVG